MKQKSDAVSILSRVPKSEFLAIEDWRRAQSNIPTLSAAIRELIRRGIKADKTKLGAKLDRAGAGELWQPTPR